jgi:serine/threonine-protein kinase RIO1
MNKIFNTRKYWDEEEVTDLVNVKQVGLSVPAEIMKTRQVLVWKFS